VGCFPHVACHLKDMIGHDHRKRRPLFGVSEPHALAADVSGFVEDIEQKVEAARSHPMAER
ncbi:MAG TPA: hypothetical protein PKC95_10920, partial [Thauera aminoaromatica]|nr:hypothetical protein [Thauera aminoaromatica]